MKNLSALYLEHQELHAKMVSGISTDEDLIRIGQIEELFSSMEHNPFDISALSIEQKILVVSQELIENLPFTNTSFNPKSLDECVDTVKYWILSNRFPLELVERIFVACCFSDNTYIDLSDKGKWLFLSHPEFSRDQLVGMVREGEIDIKSLGFDLKPKFGAKFFEKKIDPKEVIS